ncbi:MAG: prepilin-type N-terminal cleavage/methylation domain-containing protein [Candidatus Eremiobacterota bacterium]
MTRERGLTLVETLVVCALLGILGTLTYWVHRTGHQAYRARERRDQAERAVLLTMERLRSEVDRGARISQVQRELHMLFPLRSNGRVEVGAAGQPVYGTDSVVYRVDSQGNLLRQEGAAPPRLVVRLGRGGQASFQLEAPQQNVLRVDLVVDDPVSPCRQTSRIYLRNQP